MKNNEEIPVENSKPHESIIDKFCNCFTYVITGIIISVVILFTSCAVFVSFISPPIPSEDDIDEIVNDNKDKILEAIKDGKTQKLKIHKVKKINSLKDGSIINFYCGNSGDDSSGNESGFYYTKTDEPEVVLNYSGELKKSDEGYWECDDKNGNDYLTDKICDNFYYYYGDYFRH